jgi:hypothetical protein
MILAQTNSVGTGKNQTCSITVQSTEELAEFLSIPTDNLRRGGVTTAMENGHRFAVVTARDEAGHALAALRCRSTDDGLDWEWLTGKPAAPLLIGLDHLDEAVDQAFVVVVDLLTDYLLLRHHGSAALGAGDRGALNTIELRHVERLKTVFVVQGPGTVGEEFVAVAVERLREIGFSADVKIVRLPGGHASVTDLHKSNPSRCRAVLRDALARAAGVPMLGVPKLDIGRRNAEESRKLTAALKGAGLKEANHREVIRASWEAGGGLERFSLTNRKIATEAGMSERWVEQHLGAALDELEALGLPLIERLGKGWYNRHTGESRPSMYGAPVMRRFLELIEAERPVSVPAYAVVGRDVAARVAKEVRESRPAEARLDTRPARAAAESKREETTADYALDQMRRLVARVTRRAMSPGDEMEALLKAVTPLMDRIAALEALQAGRSEEEERQHAVLDEIEEDLGTAEFAVPNLDETDAADLETAEVAGSNSDVELCGHEEEDLLHDLLIDHIGHSDPKPESANADVGTAEFAVPSPQQNEWDPVEARSICSRILDDLGKVDDALASIYVRRTDEACADRSMALLRAALRDLEDCLHPPGVSR